MRAIPEIDLDHVAVAVERQRDVWPRYGGDLPSTWEGGGASPGFDSAQVVYANGMKVEVLEPYDVESNDFLRRFLDRNGPGPHHMTFKVTDIVEAIELADQAGYRPVNVDLRSDSWKEAFLHPKDAPGVVVQLAQMGGSGDWGPDPTPDWFPAPRVESHAGLVHVAHAVAEMEEGRRLFVGLLSGEVVAEGGGDGGGDGIAWVDLAWPGPGRVRLLAGAPLQEWLGGRAGRVHHLAFATQAPAGVPGATGTPGGDTWEVAPHDNYGVRLIISETAEPFADRPLG